MSDLAIAIITAANLALTFACFRMRVRAKELNTLRCAKAAADIDVATAWRHYELRRSEIRSLQTLCRARRDTAAALRQENHTLRAALRRATEDSP